MIELVELEAKFDLKIMFTEYYGMKKVIPRTWYQMLKGETEGEASYDWYDKHRESKIITKLAYEHFIQNENLLQPILGMDQANIGYEDLLNAIMATTKITNYMKLRPFQYRLLNKAIITNVHLCRYNIRTYDLCTLCNLEKETLHHILYECCKIKGFLIEEI